MILGLSLTNFFLRCALFLKNHPDIYILRSDKGNVTVARLKDQYLSKSQELLNDTNYYKKLNRNPTYTLQLKANRFVKKLKDGGFIGEEEASKLNIYNSVAPRFYTLPKIHKPTLSMRPIVSSINSPNSSLAKYITDLLTLAYNTDNPFYVKDSFQFGQFINNYKIPDDYVIVSFDVVSLFTNLPLDVILNSIQKRWDYISNYCNLSFSLFSEIMHFIFDSNILVFNDTFYQQIFGTPMGSTLSPILVNFVLDDLVGDCVTRMPFPIPFVKRYVDDTLLAVPSGQIDTALTVFNSYNQHIQFTVEAETNNSVPFLDMLVIRTNDNILKTKWYRKPYCSNRFISFQSYHPMKTKMNLLIGMKARAIKLSHPDFRETALRQLRDIMVRNSYPVTLVNKVLFSTPDNLNDQSSINTNLSVMNGSASNNSTNPTSSHSTENTQSQKFYSLPFIENLTFHIVNIFRDTTVKIAKRQLKTLNSIFSKPKTPLDMAEISNVVYKIPCLDCGRSYIGQTSRCLKGRITSHKSDCRKKLDRCALAEHTTNTNHQIGWDDTEILERASSYYKRTFLEMVHINLEPNPINKKSDTQNLSTIYCYVLKVAKDREIALMDSPAPDE